MRTYRIYSNQYRSNYYILHASIVALIWGRYLFEGGIYLKVECNKELY